MTPEKLVHIFRTHFKPFINTCPSTKNYLDYTKHAELRQVRHLLGLSQVLVGTDSFSLES